MARPASKQDLLEYLVENHFATEDDAVKAAKLGIISINNKVIKRPGIKVNLNEDKIKVIGGSKLFVSRGGYKLQKALEAFDLNIQNQICLDVGSSTGGFTDCMLQYGASKVYAIDTGYGQLDWELRKNSKVQCFERTNMRYLMPEKLYKAEDLENNQKATFIGIDVSFISVIKLIPSIQRLCLGPDKVKIACLVKPQFEAGKNQVGRGGVIRNPGLHFDILNEFVHSCYRAGLDMEKLTHSPLLGASGNLEFLALLTWPKAGRKLNPNLEAWIKKEIEIAYEDFNL